MDSRISEREEIRLLEAQAHARQFRRRLVGTALAFAWCVAWGLWGMVETGMWLWRMGGGE